MAISTTGLNFIILPTSMTGVNTSMLNVLPAMTTIKPLTVITTAAVNKPQYSGTPPLKPAKKFRDEQEEILRCKRRLDFASLGLKSLQRPQTATVMRRNERERNRVKLINHTFTKLRHHLPQVGTTSKGKNKKISKVDTLRHAIDYIRGLQDLIDDHDAISTAFNDLSPTCTTAPTNTSTVSFQSSQPSPTSISGTDSTGMAVNSPGSTCSSAGSSPEDHVVGELEPPLSPEDEDLLLGDFANWLNECQADHQTPQPPQETFMVSVFT